MAFFCVKIRKRRNQSAFPKNSDKGGKTVVMVKSKLLKVSYRDAANGISLTAYADTLVIDASILRKRS